MTSIKRQRDDGFTLVEILIAIVLVGILSAVVVVGISNLTSKGSTAACQASLDAAKAGATVYYSTNSNAYPTTFNQMTGTTPPALTVPSGVTVNTAVQTVGGTSFAIGTVLNGSGWILTLTAGSNGAAPTFACS